MRRFDLAGAAPRGIVVVSSRPEAVMHIIILSVMYLVDLLKRSLMPRPVGPIPQPDKVKPDPLPAAVFRLKDCEELIADPSDYFAKNGAVRIPAAKWQFLRVCIAAAGILFGLFEAYETKRFLDPNNAWLKGPWWEAGVVLSCLIYVVGYYKAAAFLLPGASAVLTAAGVAFEYHSRVVFCPWAAIDTDSEIEPTDTRAIDVPLRPDLLGSITATVDGELDETDVFGRKPFRVLGGASNGGDWAAGRIYDDYRYPVEKIGTLILRVAQSHRQLLSSQWK